jgi:hypothetical protein
MQMKRRHDDAGGYKRGVRGFASDENKFREPESTVWKPSDEIFDTVKRGKGIDGNKGVGILNDSKPDDSWKDQGEAGRSIGGKDLWDAVEGQSSDLGNRKVRSGDSD